MQFLLNSWEAYNSYIYILFRAPISALLSLFSRIHPTSARYKKCSNTTPSSQVLTIWPLFKPFFKNHV